MSDFIVKFALVILAVAVHELGHIAAAKLVGVKRFYFSLKPNGALLTFDFSHVTYAREAVVHLSGGLLGLLSVYAAQKFFPAGGYINYFTGLSLSFTVINYLPLHGLDGCGFLNAVMSTFLLPDSIYYIMKVLSWATTVLLLAAVIYIELRIKTNLGLAFFVASMLITAEGENNG